MQVGGIVRNLAGVSYRKALHVRRRCQRPHRWLLARVAAVTWNAALQAQALATLKDSDPETVTGAAGVPYSADKCGQQ